MKGHCLNAIPYQVRNVSTSYVRDGEKIAFPSRSREEGKRIDVCPDTFSVPINVIPNLPFPRIESSKKRRHV